MSDPAPGSAPEAPTDLVTRMGEDARRIGHDLNNVLGVISGRAELMVMHLDRGNADGARKGVEVILGQMEKMKALSDELRNLRNGA